MELLSLLPDGIAVWAAILLCAASFLTSGLTAAFGIGGGVTLLALMALILPVGALIPIHGVVQFGSNAGRAWIRRSDINWRAMLYFLAGAIAGSAAGAQFVVNLHDGLLKVLLGVFIFLIVRARVPAMQQTGPAGFSAGGFVTTFVSMFVGASGPLVLALFEKTFDGRRTIVGTHAAAMSFQHVLKVAAFVLAGFAFGEWLPLMAAMIATGYAGTIAGSRLLDGMNDDGFRRGFKILMSLLAIVLVIQGASTLYSR